MSVTTVKTISEADLRESVEELLDEIVSGDETCWQEYADRMAAETASGFKIGLFKVWSSTNRLNLAAQVRRRGDVVHGMYAGIDQWRLRERTPREGEVPYIIFGPPAYFKKATQAANPAPAGQPTPTPAQGATPAQPAPPQGQMHFRRPPRIEVFDYSQTVADDPDYVEPDWSVPLAGGDLTTLQTLIGTSPVPVRFIDIGSKVEHGWLDKDGIVVDSSMTVADQISTLAHELAHHHLGHLDQVPDTRSVAGGQDVRARCEQEAALAQFFVMKMLGMDETVGVNITAAAGLYLRTWLKVNDDGTTTPIEGHKGRRKLLKARFDAAFRAAQAIVSAYVQATQQ